MKRVAIAAVVLVLLVGGALVIRHATRKPVEVFSVGVVSVGQIDDGNMLSGAVAQGDVQAIKLMETPVESIKVKEGDSVKAGDILATYDNTQVKLTKLSHSARLGAAESELRRAQRELARVSSLKPAPADGGGGNTEPPVQKIDHGNLPFVDKLTRETKPPTKGQNADYYFEATGGKSLYDLVFFVTPDTLVTSDFLRMLKEQNKSCELRLFTVNQEGQSMRVGSWVLVGSLLPADTADSSTQTADTGVDVGTDTGEDAAVGTTDGGTSDSADQTAPDASSETNGDMQHNSGDDAGEQGDTGGSSPDSTEDPTTKPKANPAYAEWRAGEGLIAQDGHSLEKKPKLIRSCGVYVALPPLVYERFEIVPIEDDGSSVPEEESHTREELNEMIREQQAAVENARLDVREARVAVQQDKFINDKGEVTAKIAGKVSKVADLKKIKKGDTVLVVQGKAAYTVTLYVDELMRDAIKIGDSYRITTFMSGASGLSEVKNIGTVPVSDQQYGPGNPSSSFYPVTCAVSELDDPSMSFEVGEGCSATKESSEGESMPLNIEKMYVRTDNKGSFVMVANEHGKLERRGVQVGKIYWGSIVEIKRGLTPEDKIAFPYGRDVVEGAATKTVDGPSMDF